jgi:ADP-ribose pyrophosphatase YjhB (NUDIX family)
MQAKQIFFAYDRQERQRTLEYKYCPLCGAQLELKMKGGKRRLACPDCGFVHFQNPSPGVVVVIERDGSVLLGERSGSFGKGKWCLPQGYVEFDDDFLTAACREVKEETGLDVELRSILSVVSNFLTPRLHTLAIILLARVVSGEPCAADDLQALKWFPLAGPLPPMAFKADQHIIERLYTTGLEGAPVDPEFATSALR